jgi:FkbM family methyltransferase
MTVQKLETRYGTMFVPDTDSGQWAWLTTIQASPEDEQIQTIAGLLDERPRGLVLDCGANFGCWSLGLAPHAIGVLAFEPQRAIFNILCKTIAANHSMQHLITPFPLALGPASGTIMVPDVPVDKTTNFGGVSLGFPHSEHPDAPMYEVTVVRLDDIASKFDVPVSFIKADVEGAEVGLFEGARKTIERWKPIIVAEADHPLTDRFALGNLIESMGYNVEILQDNNFIGMPL